MGLGKTGPTIFFMNEMDSEIVTKEVAEKILLLQQRCCVCGGTFRLEIHHRIFRSEWELLKDRFFKIASYFYRRSYGKELPKWGLHSIQNLIVLCQEHHTGVEGVHGKNTNLRIAVRNSFTCPVTGFNIPYLKA